MKLANARIVVVARDEDAAEGRARSLRSEGADVRAATVSAFDLATLRAHDFHAIVLDVGTEPALFAAFAGEPGIVVVAPNGARVAQLGALVTDTAHLVDTLAAHVERALRARAIEDKLRNALAAIEGLKSETRTLAHDGRVLCGLVVGYGANMRDGLAGPLSPMQTEHIANVLQAANDLAALFERYGEAMRSQAKTPSVPTRAASRTRVDLADLTRRTTRLFENLAAEKKIVIDVDASEAIRAWCDALEMKQVVTNLVVNAIKFTPIGGRVSVSVRAAKAKDGSGAKARGHVEIIVRDTGPGIASADRERVFTRGVRLDRDADVAGSGLGLAVVRDLLADNGGTVRIDDSSEGGAIFVVTLPFDKRTRRAGEVVVVDDAERARRILATLSTDPEVQALGDDRGALAKMLEDCAAVLVVPSKVSR